MIQSLLTLIVMKTICLYGMIAICSVNTAFAEIKNGYESKIYRVRDAVALIMASIPENENLTNSKKREIKDHLKVLSNFIAYHELTRQLIDQFKEIAPDLYDEINSIADNNGRPVDVYVQFVPYNTESPLGMNVMMISPSDRDIYSSEFGENTASIKIQVVANALFVLSHELGHLKYQIPNIGKYADYLKSNYRAGEHSDIGHRFDDLSGKCAIQYEWRYSFSLSAYHRATTAKLEGPGATLQCIQRQLKQTLLISKNSNSEASDPKKYLLAVNEYLYK